jgi:hypothetical protein
MARGIEGNEVSTPKPAAKKIVASSKSEKGQRSIVSFFQKASTSTPALKPLLSNGPRTRPSKRRKFSLEDSDDEFEVDAAMEEAMAEAGWFSACLLHFELSDASGTDDAQRILTTSSSPTIRKRMHHGLRSGKGHHPQTSPNKHLVLHPSRTSVTMTEVW